MCISWLPDAYLFPVANFSINLLLKITRGLRFVSGPSHYFFAFVDCQAKQRTEIVPKVLTRSSPQTIKKQKRKGV